MQSKQIFKIFLYLLIFLNLFFLSTILSYRVVIRGEMVTLPDLIGKTVEEAKADLAKKRLSLSLREVQFDNQWERGKIIHQNPSSGSKIKINKAVKIILSAGSEQVIVPNLEGKTLKSASQILKDAGLRKGETSQVHSSDRAAGKIVAQQPPLLEKVGRNTPVSLLVSQGEREKKYLMPDLIGKKSAPAIAKLKRMDFRVGVVRYSYYPGLEPGIIIKQLPPHGYRIQKNNLITLEVSKE
jgi:beta-lactam-binding protein with PASTA domain